MRTQLTMTALALAWLAGVSPGSQGADPRAEVEQVLQRAQFGAAEIATLQSGAVIARSNATSDGEIVTQAAVKIRVPNARVASYYGQMIAYVDGSVTLGFGKFSDPAVPADVAQLAFDRNEVDQLRACRVGSCDIRLGGAAISTLQSSIDWKAPDYPDRVNAFARKAAIDYITAYRARGDAALVTYNDKGTPVSLQKEWASLLEASSGVHALLPDLARYLSGYPKAAVPGARDIFYWIKENYGRKPVLSLVHAVVYSPPGQPDRTVVAQKYLYASHYYDASMALAWVASGTENGAPVSYLVYANRSRGGALRGGLGVTRSVAEGQAREAAKYTLGTIKQVLETSR